MSEIWLSEWRATTSGWPAQQLNMTKSPLQNMRKIKLPAFLCLNSGKGAFSLQSSEENTKSVLHQLLNQHIRTHRDITDNWPPTTMGTFSVLEGDASNQARHRWPGGEPLFLWSDCSTAAGCKPCRVSVLMDCHMACPQCTDYNKRV